MRNKWREKNRPDRRHHEEYVWVRSPMTKNLWHRGLISKGEEQLYILLAIVQMKCRPEDSRTWSALLAGFWDILAKALHFLSVKYLTGLGQSLAVRTYTLNIMVYPKHRWYEQIMIPEFSGMKFFEPEIFSKKFQFKFLITEKIQVPRLKTSRKVTSKLYIYRYSVSTIVAI